MFSDSIAQLCIDQIEFTDDALEALVEDTTAKNAALFRSALEFERAAPEGVDFATTGAGIVTLASTFGLFYEQLTGDQVARLRQAFADVFTQPTPEEEQAGEALFNACVDFIASAKALNTYVAEIGG